VNLRKPESKSSSRAQDGANAHARNPSHIEFHRDYHAEIAPKSRNLTDIDGKQRAARRHQAADKFPVVNTFLKSRRKWKTPRTEIPVG
jgi:hypothetical protein